MSNIFTPVNQKTLTNIAVVRISKKGKRFEIACFKNKVMDWREGVEADLSQVMQVQDVVFTNVSKGEIAKKDLLSQCFGTDNMAEICLLILKTGDLQVSGKERKEMLDNKFKQIANIIADKCIDPETGVPHQHLLIQKAMKEIHYSVKPNQSAKKQALEVIPKLSNIISIRRASMRVKVTLASKEAKKQRVKIVALMMALESDDHSGEDTVLVGVVSPGSVKAITDLVQETTKGQGCVEVLCLKEATDADPIL